MEARFMGGRGPWGGRFTPFAGPRGPGGAWGGFGFGRDFGRGFRGAWDPRGPRARRGDVRAAILALLAERPMHGYQVIQELENRSGGAWRVSPGSVYPTLQMLEEEGLIAGQEVEGKRVYSLTDSGRAQVESHNEGARAPWDEFGAGDETLHGLRDAALKLGAAAMQVTHAGSKEQVDRAIGILNEARRQLYAILAEDSPEAGR
ncbi:MAG: PadR family transcriptional regulator [Chloroflexi bacterium]|nr:MAG: PadR family transcriptional regulator [Chloroflexota bacterium]